MAKEILSSTAYVLDLNDEAHKRLPEPTSSGGLKVLIVSVTAMVHVQVMKDNASSDLIILCKILGPG